MKELFEKKLERRGALALLGSLGAVIVGCGSSVTDSAGAAGSGGSGGAGGAGGRGSTRTTTTTASTGGGGAGGAGGAADVTACEVIPDETSGPYPDKMDMFDDEAFYRRDVTEGKAGIALAVTFTVVDASNGCAKVTDAVVEIWHCDSEGHYSEYAGQPGYDGSGTTFLRGLQKADANGQVTFDTIYPGWYSGRATHIHVDVYVGGKIVKTTQMAFEDALNAKVYAVAPYASHGQNPMTNAEDMVFGDGDTYELAQVTGDTTSGFEAKLVVGIAS